MSWLIVSADPDLRDYLLDCLEPLSPAGGAVAVADAFEALGRIAGGGVELVVCDVDLPRMGGLEVARVLASSPVEVLLLSAEFDAEEAAAAGAGGVVRMPFCRCELSRRVAEVLAPARGATSPPGALSLVAAAGSSTVRPGAGR